jgi:cupin fold WbuC family metalloprotein
MKKVDTILLDTLGRKAGEAVRLRTNLNFHESYDAPVQRMINAMEPGTYLQPHKHENPDKTESFFILRGRLLVVEFDDEGRITDHAILDHDTGMYGVELPPRTWHTVVCLEPGSAAWEVKDGPYIPITDKNFAPWAPKEGDAGTTEYIRDILRQLGIHL